MSKRFVTGLVTAILILTLTASALAAPTGMKNWSEQIYEQVYRQLRQQLGNLFSQARLEKLAEQLTQQVLAQLEGRPGAPGPEKPKPNPTPKPKPRPEPTNPSPTDPTPPAPKPDQTDEPPRSDQLAPAEARLLELTNQARAQAGLKPLTLDLRLVETAREKSADMRDNNYFGHISPSLGSPFDQMQKAGVRYWIAGENLAGAPTADAAYRALMNSPGHKANILSPSFTQVGIGIAVGGPYGIYFTQQFTG